MGNRALSSLKGNRGCLHLCLHHLLKALSGGNVFSSTDTFDFLFCLAERIVQQAWCSPRGATVTTE